jgi:hypothetical protein
MHDSRELQQKIKVLREILTSLPNINAKQLKILQLNINTLAPLEIIDNMNTSKEKFMNEDSVDCEHSLNDDIKYYLISLVKKTNIDTEHTVYSILFNVLSLLTYELVYQRQNLKPANNYLAINLWQYLVQSPLVEPIKQLHSFLAKLWAENDPSLISNDNATLLIANSHPKLAIEWLQHGFKPFTPTSNNGESLADYYQTNHKYRELDNILTIFIHKTLQDLTKFVPVDIYQDLVFINQKLLYLEYQNYQYSTALTEAVKQLFSLKTHAIIEQFQHKTTNVVTLWIFNKLKDLLETRQVFSNNRMLDLAIFINPVHNYLAYDAITNGANPLNEVIKIGNNPFVSFLDILIQYHRTAELARIFAYYTKIYQQAIARPSSQPNHPQNQFAINLATFISQNYEHTPNNAEELLSNLLIYLSRFTPETCKTLNLKIGFLYTTILTTAQNMLSVQDYHSFLGFMLTLAHQPNTEQLTTTLPNILTQYNNFNRSNTQIQHDVPRNVIKSRCTF